jgi:hypothetical protein
MRFPASALVHGLLAALAVSAAAPWAFANAAATFRNAPEEAESVVLAGPTPVEVLHEKLVFDCDGTEFAPVCSFTATYQIHNPTAGEESVAGAFTSPGTANVHARFHLEGGKDAAESPADATLTDEQRGKVGETLRKVRSGWDSKEDQPLSGFKITLGAGANGVLVFSGTMHPVRESWDHQAYALHPIKTRHLLLAPRDSGERSFEFVYLVAPIRSWSGDPVIDVEARYPSSWSIDPFQAGGGPKQYAHEGPKTRVIGRLSKNDDELGLRFYIPARFVWNGGPVVGYGLRVDQGEPRFRAAYEIAAASPTFVFAAGYEDNFRGRHVIVPSFDVASPSLLFLIPSFALGAGIPVEIRDGQSALVGGRLSVTVAWPVISFIFPIDLYPAGRGHEFVSFSFMAQLSL